MPVFVRWYIPDRVIFVEDVGDVVSEEVLSADKVVCAMMDESSYPVVHVLMNSMAQTSDSALSAYRSIKSPKHPKAGWCIEYAPRGMGFRIIGFIVANIFHIAFRQVDTYEHAITMLLKLDPSLKEVLQDKSFEPSMYS